MSPIIYHVELNGFALAILVVIFLNMRRRSRQYAFDQQLFLALIVNVILLLALNMLLWCLDGRPGPFARILSVAAIVLYNSLNPTVCVIWTCYADYYINENKARLKKVALWMGIPAALNMILSVVSIFTPFYFVFDRYNAYHSGPFVFILLGICALLLLPGSVLLTLNRKKLGRSVYTNMLLFALFPMAGGVIQFFFHGLDLIWLSATVSILMIFINIQKDQLYTDYLTNLYNRRHFDNYLQSLPQHEQGYRVGGIMIDLDDFKAINDVYGHESGDQALKDMAEILKNTFRKSDFIARYGGDEFLVMLQAGGIAEVEILVQRLKDAVALHNAQSMTPYDIKLSIGYACYDKEADGSMAAFLKRLDRLMYLDKQRHG